MRFTRRCFIASFKASLPVLLGYLAMGIAAGVLLSSRTGLGCFWGFVTSASSISGALQFLLVDMFHNQTPLITVALITLSINLRYALYGLPLLERWRNLRLPLKLYMILTLTDETFALEVANNVPEGEDSLTYCFQIAALDHLYWITGVVSGCLAGQLLPFNSKGIDFAMTALFIVVLLDQLEQRGNRLPALIGTVSALIGLALYPQNMLIPSIAILLMALVALRRHMEVKQNA